MKQNGNHAQRHRIVQPGENPLQMPCPLELGDSLQFNSLGTTQRGGRHV